MTLRTLLIASVATLALAAPAVADVPENADWTEAYIETPGEPTLHADILKPKGTPEDAKLPVILSIGPYHGHGGQSTPNGPSDADRPSTRWTDLIEDGGIFEKGYILVMADLRGFGASHGCNDFGGTGEQTDVKRAVEWAAQQPWSTGKVALYGKSYDGWTGVMGLDEKPKGLAAAVILAPIIDGYRTLYQNGVHYDAGWYATPGLYQQIDLIPPAPSDGPEYFSNWAQGINPACYADNFASQNTTVDRDTPFWQERELVNARGSDVPVIWSHGFLDANTKPDNFLPVWETLKGPTMGWFGQYDHVRPNETAVGREGFFNEMWPFLDRYVKGDTSQDAAIAANPKNTIQEGDGRWRAEEQWPPADAKPYTMEIGEGSVTDAPNNEGEGDTTGQTGVGAWNFGPPVPHEARIAGTPKVKLDVSAIGPRAHVYTLLYDVGPDPENESETIGTLISRAAHVVTGEETLEFELYPQDWTLQPGHRLGLLVAGSDLDWYNPPHSGQTVDILGGQLTVPFLSYQRTKFLEGDVSQAMLNRDPIPIDPAELEERSVAAQIPPALVPAPGPTGKTPPPRGTRTLGLKVKVKRLKGRRVRVVVKRAGSNTVRISVRRNGKTVRSRAVKAKRGKARAKFRTRGAGKYRVTARLVGARVKLKGRSKAFKVR